VVLDRLARGSLHLSAINLFGPKLTDDNHLELLDAAAGKSKAEVQQLLAERLPAPDAPTVLRKLPSHIPPQPDSAPQPVLALASPSAPGSPAPAANANPSTRPSPELSVRRNRKSG
jgi:hypothetical protein